MNKKLAKITKAGLNIQGLGILTFWIHVNYEEGMSQGVGGIALDDYCKERKTRIGTAYGCELIRKLLLELGVDDFSEMKGQIIWVLGQGGGLSFEPKGIQSLSINNKNSKPILFSEMLKQIDDSEQ